MSLGLVQRAVVREMVIVPLKSKPTRKTDCRPGLTIASVSTSPPPHNATSFVPRTYSPAGTNKVTVCPCQRDTADSPSIVISVGQAAIRMPESRVTVRGKVPDFCCVYRDDDGDTRSANVLFNGVVEQAASMMLAIIEAMVFRIVVLLMIFRAKYTTLATHRGTPR